MLLVRGTPVTITWREDTRIIASVAAARADVFALFVNKIDKNLKIFVKIDAIKS